MELKRGCRKMMGKHALYLYRKLIGSGFSFSIFMLSVFIMVGFDVYEMTETAQNIWVWVAFYPYAIIISYVVDILTFFSFFIFHVSRYFAFIFYIIFGFISFFFLYVSFFFFFSSTSVTVSCFDCIPDLWLHSFRFFVFPFFVVNRYYRHCRGAERKFVFCRHRSNLPVSKGCYIACSAFSFIYGGVGPNGFHYREKLARYNKQCFL